MRKKQIQVLIQYHYWGTGDCKHENHAKCCQFMINEIAELVGYTGYKKSNKERSN